MAKKHQIKISSKSGRQAAGKSWRADAKESLTSQVTQVGYLDQAKKIAKADRRVKNLAIKNKLENQKPSLPSAADAIRSRERATPCNTFVGGLVMVASWSKKPKVTLAVLKEWFLSGDALISVWQGNHWKERRADSVNLYMPTKLESDKFNGGEKI